MLPPEEVLKDLSEGYPSREAWAKSFMGEEKYNDVVKRLTKFDLSFNDAGNVIIDHMNFPMVCIYHCRLGRGYDPVNIDTGEKVKKPAALLLQSMSEMAVP